MATNAMCCTTWIPVSFVLWASRQPMSRKPVSPKRSAQIWSGKGKQTFTLDWERQIIRCPAAQEMPFVLGGVVHFPKETCAGCPLKAQCPRDAQRDESKRVEKR